MNLLQSTSARGNGPTTLAFGSDNSASTLLIVAVAAVTSGKTFAVSDTQGNAYSSFASFLNGAGGIECQIFYCLSAKSGPNTVSFNPGAAVDTIIAIHEFPSTLSMDASVSGNGTAATMDSGGAATASANELLFGFASGTQTSATSLTPGAGYAQAEASLTSPFYLTEWQAVSVQSTYDATATIGLGKSGSASWGAGLGTFVIPASGSQSSALTMMGTGK